MASTPHEAAAQNKPAASPQRAGPVITRCPICGGELQATLEDYASRVVLSPSGTLVDYEDAGCGDVRIYCENDHSETEIRAALGVE